LTLVTIRDEFIMQQVVADKNESYKCLLREYFKSIIVAMEVQAADKSMQIQTNFQSPVNRRGCDNRSESRISKNTKTSLKRAEK
jgi:hypothetical protein